MSSRPSKVPNHLRDDWTVISADSDDGPSERVTYLSKNTRDGRQFDAVSPPNSIHAKKLAELAMIVQSNQRGGHRRPVAALSSGHRVAQIAPAMYQTQMPQTQEVPDTAGPRGFYDSGTAQGPVMAGVQTSPDLRTQTPSAAYVAAPSYCPQQYPQTSSGNQLQQSVPQSQQYTVLPPETPKAYKSELQPVPDPRYQPPEVYRYSTDQQTGYTVTTRTGELRVSAPVGSSEAQAFDGVVEKMSSKVCVMFLSFSYIVSLSTVSILALNRDA
jgi:hypothetical protein